MNKVIFYIGTYTRRTSKGIYGVYMDPATKEFSSPSLFAEAGSPTYLAFNQEKTILYSVSEPAGSGRGAVAAYSVEPYTGHLSKINEVLAPGGGLCHLSLDSSDSWLFTVSYGDATVQVYPINKDGSIGEVVCVREHTGQGPNLSRQEKAHAHMTCLTPDEKYLCICDLGTDQVVVYQFCKETGQLLRDDVRTVTLLPGCGPRHMIFHPNGKTAYVLSELTSQVFVMSYDEVQGFTVLQTIDALLAEDPNSTAAAIRVSSNGKYLYTSNRGEDSISLFHIDPETGLLKHISNTSTQGEHPRDFILDSTGTLLLCANQETDNIAVYDVSDESGEITPLKEIKGISMPVCILEKDL